MKTKAISCADCQFCNFYKEESFCDFFDHMAVDYTSDGCTFGEYISDRGKNEVPLKRPTDYDTLHQRSGHLAEKFKKSAEQAHREEVAKNTQARWNRLRDARMYSYFGFTQCNWKLLETSQRKAYRKQYFEIFPEEKKPTGPYRER